MCVCRFSIPFNPVGETTETKTSILDGARTFPYPSVPLCAFGLDETTISVPFRTFPYPSVPTRTGPYLAFRLDETTENQNKHRAGRPYLSVPFRTLFCVWPRRNDDFRTSARLAFKIIKEGGGGLG